jgi:hypothetical protein
MHDEPTEASDAYEAAVSELQADLLTTEHRIQQLKNFQRGVEMEVKEMESVVSVREVRENIVGEVVEVGDVNEDTGGEGGEEWKTTTAAHLPVHWETAVRNLCLRFPTIERTDVVQAVVWERGHGGRAGLLLEKLLADNKYEDDAEELQATTQTSALAPADGPIRRSSSAPASAVVTSAQPVDMILSPQIMPKQATLTQKPSLPKSTPPTPPTSSTTGAPPIVPPPISIPTLLRPRVSSDPLPLTTMIASITVALVAIAAVRWLSRK